MLKPRLKLLIIITWSNKFVYYGILLIHDDQYAATIRKNQEFEIGGKY